jgi:hypothetical protein
MPSSNWAPTILEQFEIADRYSTDINEYCGPYNTLLTDLFPHTEGFQVVPDFKAPITFGSINFTTRLVVRYRKIQFPVFFIDIKPALHLEDISTRAKADEQMHEQFESIAGQKFGIPKLYGISALGIRFSLYNYNEATGIISPPSSSHDSMQFIDVAPVNRWNLDLLEKIGEEKFKETVAEVKAMCEAITACWSFLIIFIHCLIKYFTEGSRWVDRWGREFNAKLARKLVLDISIILPIQGHVVNSQSFVACVSLIRFFSL